MNLSRIQASHRAIAALGIALFMPALLFASASILKYELGLPFLYDHLGFLARTQSVPIYHAVSPFLFLGGPLVAAILNVAHIFRLNVEREGDEVVSTISLRPRAWNVAVIATSSVVFAILTTYVVVENLTHHLAGA